MFENNKKILFIISVGGAFVLLGIVFIFLNRSKQSQILPTYIPEPTPVQGNTKQPIATPLFIKRTSSQTSGIAYDFSQLRPSLLTSANSYIVKSNQITQRMIDRIINVNQLEPNYEEITNSDGTHTLYWYDADRSRTLTLLLEKGGLSFTNSRVLAKGEGSGELLPLNTTREDIIQIAASYIQKDLSLPPDIKASKENVLFLTKYSENGGTEESFQNASIFQVSFEQFLEGKKVYRQLGDTARVLVQINKQKQITRFTYQYPTIEKYRLEKLLSFTEIEQIIENNQGSIVKIGNTVADTTNLSLIKSVSFTTIENAFFDDETSGFIQPVFVLTGTAQLQDDSNEPITMVVRGIK